MGLIIYMFSIRQFPWNVISLFVPGDRNAEHIVDAQKTLTF